MSYYTSSSTSTSQPSNPSSHLALTGTKWHANYNSFLCFHDTNHTLTLQPQHSPLTKLLIHHATQLTHPHSGMGADGILIFGQPEINNTKSTKNKPIHHIEPQNSATHHITLPLIIVNRDGSIAQNCINGLRVAAGEFSRWCRNNSLWNSVLHQNQPFSISVYSGHSYDCTVHSNHSHHQFGWACQVTIRCRMDVLYPQHFQLSATQIASAAREFIASQQWLHDNDHVGCYHVGNNHLVWLVATDSVHIAQLPAYYSSILSKLHKHLTQVLGGDHLNVHLCYQQSLKHKTDPKHSPTCYIASWERGVGRTESCGSGAVAASICHREWQLQHSTQDSGTPSKPVPITFVGDHADQWLMVQTTYEPNLTESDQPNNQGYLAHITGTATYIGQIQTELSPPHG